MIVGGMVRSGFQQDFEGKNGGGGVVEKVVVEESC
jgi:hypothetical protein